MSNISFLNPYSSAASTSVESLLSSSSASAEDSPTADAVTLSDEAIELLEELRYKENLSHITTDSEYLFDKASKRLPSTEEFTDMLNWLSSQQAEQVFTIGGDDGIVNRNAYEKDPTKYAELWTNLYNHFNGLMESLGLDGEDSMMREVLANDDVQLELMTRYKNSFDDRTNSLLSFFNITV